MNYKIQLKSSGLKVTEPRLKILALFERHAGEHMSADEIYRLIVDERGEGEKLLGVATVYRVLGQLEQSGILLRHQLADGKAVYELNLGEPHAHVICIVCNKIKEFSDPAVDRLQKEMARDTGYEILDDHALYIYGLCPECVEHRDNLKYASKHGKGHPEA